ncbi:SDR family NAD(P)-dependent oxidoreductase [Sphingobium fluviale]|uniref:SDR family NAD(P)-dependent oxidoreductase n=1 Tax=Sphingobium fluviale TaxID=2506423 RepID=UPI00248211E9|nr:SDR family oxidoreductase [Sphingobium fluviale]
MVNNAGIVPHEALADVTVADWRRTMAINVESVMLMCRSFFPSMAERKYGRVVNLSSDQLGLTLGGFATYMATKAAIIGLTRALANEFGEQGITVNCIAPGLTKTARTEIYGPLFDELAKTQAIKRHEVPEDLVGAMSFLTSDDSSFITGQTLIVDGGLMNAI